MIYKHMLYWTLTLLTDMQFYDLSWTATLFNIIHESIFYKRLFYINHFVPFHFTGENLLENAETDELLTVSESEDGKLSVEMDDTEEQMNLLMETMTNKMLSVNQKLKVKDTVPSDVCVQSDQEDGEGSSDRPLLGNNEPPRDDLNVEC